MNVSAGEEIAGMWITRPIEGIGQYKLAAKKRADGVYEWAHYVQRASGMIDNVYRGEVPVSTDLEKVLTALNNALAKAYGPLVQLHKAAYTMRDATTGKEIGKA
jgi:hypothetical protein